MTGVLFILGSLAGVFAGLVPGVGVFTTLVMLYPFLYTLSLNEIMVLYIPMLVVSQFVGSVPALYFKIPGESTSLIATEYGHQLFAKGQHDLIPLTALGSLVATILSAMLFVVIAHVDMTWISQTFKSQILLAVIMISFAIITYTSKNLIWISVSMLLVGMILGNIGYNVGTGETWLTFSNSWLYLGLPLLSFIAGVYIIPQILNIKTNDVSTESITQAYASIWPQLKNNLATMVNGSLLGYVSGLVPIVGKIVGVNLSRFFYRHSDRRSVIASESSNNASIFSALIPLFVFGIPITLGEILIVNIAETSVFDLQNSFVEILHQGTLPWIILASGLVGVLIAWPLATYMTVFYRLPTVMLKILLIGFVLSSVIYVGWLSGVMWYMLIVLFALVPVGWLLKDYDLLPLLFGFIFAQMCVTMITRILI